MDGTQKFFDRDIASAVTDPVRRVGRPALREVVTEGIAAFERCSLTADGLDTPMAVLFPFLQMFELLDATETVLDTGAAAPGRVLLRAAYESWLTFEYITETDTERRAAAFLVFDIHERIKGLKRFDPTSDQGKRFRASIAKDQYGAGIEIPSLADVGTQIREYEELLTKPHLLDAAAEYERLRSALRRVPPFHACWGGPQSLEELALHLGRSGFYELLYRPSSKTAHANDLRRLLREVDGAPAITRLRSGEGLITAYFYAISMGLSAIHRLLGHYRHGELETFYPRWYQEKVRPLYWQLVPEHDGKEVPDLRDAG